MTRAERACRVLGSWSLRWLEAHSPLRGWRQAATAELWRRHVEEIVEAEADDLDAWVAPAPRGPQ